ncbi:MAG TPA: BamA/TamA family outer membrane protein [Longimicrobiales bacterium]|nr:BamA/TamA family outer membrane protein [Longimicrobiales bacterium]
MTRGKLAALVAGVTLVGGLVPSAASAQYFGRNKVQYEEFDWRVLHTDHYDIHFYPEEEEAVRDAARMAERWYTRLSRVFNHEFRDVKPIILYANHPDFQQTNTTEGTLSEGTGAFAESLKNRVVMPLTGLYAQNDHVLGHELVHAFQYDVAQRYGAMGQQGIGSLPGWLIEGMAEYLSVGREDPHTAMWLRDAALRGDLPTFEQLTSDPRFFPYRYGQALWAYIGGRWGDRAVTDLYKSSLRHGWSLSVRRILRLTPEQLSSDWLTSIRETYLPLMQGRERPEDIAQTVIAPEIDAGDMNVGPSLSPDGRWVAFYSERDLFEVGLFLADARTGKVVKRLANSQSNLHFDALSFLSSAGAWSPDGRRIAFTAFAKGDEELAIVDIESQRVVQRVRIEGVGAVTTPSWSPDGRTIALSGNRGGLSDLYLVDVESAEVQQLTADRYADLQPSWSPDGTTLAFVTDRVGTDFEALEYGPLKIGLIDVRTRRVRMLDLFPGGKHIDPQFSPDGRQLYFISDADGFTDAYRTDLESGEIFRLTRLATGVSGVTNTSPALTIASQSGDVMFSVFSEGNFNIYRMDAAQVEARAQPVAERFAEAQAAGILPPVEGVNRGLVESYLADAAQGLPAAQEFPVTDYDSGLALDYIGVPTLGGSFGGPFGTMISGAVATFWSDMLGNRQLVAAVQANGGIKDVGGQVQYLNRKGRTNWGVIAGHVPLQLAFYDARRGDRATGQPDTIALQIFRIYQSQVSGLYEIPRSRTRRWEFNGGYTRYGFGLEELRVLLDPNTGQQVGEERADLDPGERLGADFGDDLNLVTASAAYVGDWSYFGFTSPVRGGRFRFEVSPMLGDMTVVNGLADYRRYFWTYPFTFALRGLHFGRYGPDAEGGNRLLTRDIFLGYETLVRGYARESWSFQECVRDDCPNFGRLFGSRIAVANAEVRVPLFGVPEYGLINFPFLPTELSAFFDAGLAWYSEGACANAPSGSLGCSPTFEWDDQTARTPVASTGVSARVNVLGFMVLEAYYAYPFQRPDKGWHFGFNIAPGW